MHDTLAQGFTSIITLGHAVERELDAHPSEARRHIALMTETAQENLQESRRIIAALSPGGLEQGTLEQALARLADRFTAETDVLAVLETSGERRAIPRPIEVVALRVVQEALANVR
ncbi:sensor histidine kinase, partial [Rhizobium johnstonii]|uniref:sensor histidine kinase n=1 Tax=Rhizobium johnstonii TaxID=3019933 RepID=UPI003F9650B8